MSDTKEEFDVPEIPNFMFDFVKIILHKTSVNKHGANNWLSADGSSCNKKNMYKSIMSHTALAYGGHNPIDPDSGEDHRLHAATRLLMDYTRDKLGLVHSKDKPSDWAAAIDAAIEDAK